MEKEKKVIEEKVIEKKKPKKTKAVKKVAKKTTKAKKEKKQKTKRISMFSKEFYTEENLKKVFLEEVKKEHKIIVLFTSAIVISLIIYISLSFILNTVKVVTPVFEDIDALKYEKISKEKEKNVVFVSSPSKDYNVKYKKIINEILESKDLEIYYLDLEQVEEDNLLNTFMLTAEETKESYKDPMIIIFENGKVKDLLEEVSTKEEVLTFFEKNRID